jgi:hypothetical protein
VPVACPIRGHATGSHGEERRVIRDRAGHRLARSATGRIRDLPNKCSKARVVADGRATSHVHLRSQSQ